MEFIIDCAAIHSPEELHRAIAAYQGRNRRYGGV